MSFPKCPLRASIKLLEFRLSHHRVSLTAFLRLFQQAVRNELAFAPVAHPVVEWRRAEEVEFGGVEGKFEMAR